MNQPKIAIVAGGTGGHFFPAKALAMQLRKRNYPILFMTDKRIEDQELGSWRDVQQFVIDSAGINKKSFFKKILNSFSLLKGILEARKILKENPVSVIIGFGGYPSIPPLFAARLLPKKHRPVIILHEGNAIIGKANAILLPFATKIATSFPLTEKLPSFDKQVVTGLPVRPDITALYPVSYEIPKETIHLLIWGGSLGAKIFGDIVPYALGKLPDALRKKLRVTQQVRQEDIEKITDYYKQNGIQAELSPFLKNIAELLQQAHLVIGRSGGSSTAELSLTNRPAILVPYPYAANKEQFYNARILEKEGAAWVIDQSDFTISKLSQLLENLLTHPESLQKAALSHKTAYPHADKTLADLIENSISIHHSNRNPNQ